MKNSKKAFILLVCLACAGQQARADWSWLTGGLGRLFAPVACHWGKVLIGLGAVAGVSGGGALIKSWWDTKRRNDRLDKAVAGLAADEEERKAEELARQKKINDQQKALDDKLAVLKLATLENLKQLKDDAEKLNVELVGLGCPDQKEWIKLQLNGRLVVLMSEASQALDNAQDVPAIEGLEKQRVVFQQLARGELAVTVLTALSSLKYKMDDVLARLCEQAITEEEGRIKGIVLSSAMSDDAVQENMKKLWDKGHDKAFSLVNVLERYKPKEAQDLYGRIGKKLLVYRDLQNKRGGIFGFIQDAIRRSLGSIHDRKAEVLYKKLPLEQMVLNVVARQQGMTVKDRACVLSSIAEQHKLWEEQDSEAFGLLQLEYGEPSRRLALLKSWQESFGASYEALKTNVGCAIKELKSGKVSPEAPAFLKRQDDLRGQLKRAIAVFAPQKQ